VLAGCGGGSNSNAPVVPPTPTPPIVQAHGTACALGDQEVLFPMSGGFSVSPADSNLIVYARPDATGKFQIRRRRMNTGDDVCLTCVDLAGGPLGTWHKGVPYFLSDGASFVLQVESARNPFPAVLGAPGAGWYNNVWIASPDGGTWNQLTDFPMSATVAAGVLQPVVSPDGSRIAFAQLIGDDAAGRAAYAARQIVLGSNPFGIWRLTIGEFTSNSVAGTIGASVSRRPAPANANTGQFFEVSGWSPDSRRVLFTSDVGKDYLHKLDLWSYDIVTGDLLNLTNSDDFDEFGDYSPDGRRIIYMTSAGSGFQPTNPNSIPFGNTLATELYLMNADGSAKVRVTDLNGAGMPASLRNIGAVRGIAAKMKWSADGRAVYYEMAFFGAASGTTPGPILGSVLMRQLFAGPCGRQ
jgi:hypothetical protein